MLDLELKDQIFVLLGFTVVLVPFPSILFLFFCDDIVYRLSLNVRIA